MTNTYLSPFNKDLDLVLERQVDAPKELVWRALVEPELVKKWFCPKPWMTVDCRIDLRVGGEFYTVMQSPEGEKLRLLQLKLIKNALRLFSHVS
ncbi:MAG: hypothetical protein K0R98_930 [Rickettsiaceae bacterium]|nr:hypothetical protein [Rickettsiaceae bacterium]